MQAIKLNAHKLMKYLKNQFEFLGLDAFIRRSLTHEFLRDNGYPDHNKLIKRYFRE